LNGTDPPGTTGYAAAENGKWPSLPVAAVVPGLLFILIVDFVTVLGASHRFDPYLRSWVWVAAVLPWFTLLLFRKTPAVYGYRRRRALALLGWGMVAGAVWRGLSLGFNVWVQNDWTQIGLNGTPLIGLVFWIPFLEETFFRGYIGGALLTKYGRWPGIVTQAVLFSFHPGHWSQGWLDIVSIFVFGILSGWLYARFRSIWAPWGAHAFANVLPLLLRTWVV
jgi:membrane protease YdiL (CAAX protease family)